MGELLTEEELAAMRSQDLRPSDDERDSARCRDIIRLLDEVAALQSARHEVLDEVCRERDALKAENERLRDEVKWLESKLTQRAARVQRLEVALRDACAGLEMRGEHPHVVAKLRAALAEGPPAERREGE